jgi:hypothetical protein
MIFGQTEHPVQRVQYARAPQASPGYVPRQINTAFQTQMQPFAHVLPAMVGVIPRLPGMQAMGPGTGVRQQGVVAQAVAPPVVAPAPGQTAGFGAAPPFGGRNTGSPYKTMRAGWVPGIHANGNNLRSGAYGAGALIRRLMPAGFPNVSVPAGGYGPLPAPPPPPVMVPAPAATRGWDGWNW